MRRRLALSFAAVTAMVVLAFVVPLGALVQRVAADRAINAAQQVAATLALTLAVVEDPVQRGELVRLAAVTQTGDLSVFLPDGTVVGTQAPVDDSVLLARQGQAFTVAAPGGRAVLVPMLDASGAHVVRVFVPDAQLRRGVLRSWALLGLLAVTLLGVAVAVGDQLGRALVRPIRDLAAVASELSEGNLSARVVPSGPPELFDVGRAQNRLAARIVALLAAEREHVADLSHRLRTPITALRLEADNLSHPEEVARIAAGVDALTRAVNRIITDARRPHDGGDPPRTDLVAVTRARVAFWGALAEEEHRPYWLDVPETPCLVAVSAEDLVAMLDALLGNVLAHTPPGTAFSVNIDTAPDAPTRLIVRDDGPGLAEGSMVRGMSTGGSSGLGLDIVRRSAEAAGGRVVLGRSVGGGAQITVEFAPLS